MYEIGNEWIHDVWNDFVMVCRSDRLELGCDEVMIARCLDMRSNRVWGSLFWCEGLAEYMSLVGASTLGCTSTYPPGTSVELGNTVSLRSPLDQTERSDRAFSGIITTCQQIHVWCFNYQQSWRHDQPFVKLHSNEHFPVTAAWMYKAFELLLALIHKSYIQQNINLHHTNHPLSAAQHPTHPQAHQTSSPKPHTPSSQLL